ncbi:MAG: deoxyribonuclease IV [Chloroflexota bacterium]|nr:MAG: deoxyribonuclease IV [Chloroflexota bacterium]
MSPDEASPDGPRIGAHLPLGTGMVRAAHRAAEIGATAIQVFADNPTAWKRRAAPPRALPAFREALTAHDVAPVVIHAAYLVNLAGPERDFAARSRAVLEAELRAAPGFGARFVNVHTGSHRDTSVGAGIRRIARAVARTLEAVGDGPDAAMVVLENSVGGGWAVGSTVSELARIADAAAKLGVSEHRLGFCLDVAHAWGAGIRLDEPRVIDRFLEDVERRIGLRRLVVVHFNDSRSEPGSRLDRHEHLGGGRIGERGLGHLIRHPALRHAAFIMETPGMEAGYDLVNVARAHDLMAGRRLEPLPAAAFQLKGSRSRGAAPAPDDEEVEPGSATAPTPA